MSKGFSIALMGLGLVAICLFTPWYPPRPSRYGHQTRAVLEHVSNGLTSSLLDNGEYPTNLLTIVNNLPPMCVSSGRVCDSWGSEIRYQQIDANRFTLTSAGKDGEWGTEDDIEL